MRIVTPTAAVMRIPGVRQILTRLEWSLADSPASILGGFYVAVLRKSDR